MLVMAGFIFAMESEKIVWNVGTYQVMFFRLPPGEDFHTNILTHWRFLGSGGMAGCAAQTT